MRGGVAMSMGFPGQIRSDVISETKDVPAEDVPPKIDVYEHSGNEVEGVGGKTLHQPAVKTGSGSQSIPSNPSTGPTSQLTFPDAVQVKRQGRKPTNRVETTRRRGRKPGQILPAVDASAGQDPEVNLLLQNDSKDSSGSKAISLRSKQESDIKESTNVVQINAFGRIQTADVTDVARVMKEIFSETCSLKTKVGESSKNGDRKTESCKMPLELARSESLEDKESSAMATSEVPITGISSDNSELSNYDFKTVGDNTSLLNKAPNAQTDDCKVESEAADVPLEKSNHAFNKNLVSGSDTGVICTVPSKRPAPDDLYGHDTGASGSKAGSPVATFSVGNPSLCNENNGREKQLPSEQSPKASHVDMNECLTIPVETDDAGDHSIVIPSAHSAENPQNESLDTGSHTRTAQGLTLCTKNDNIGEHPGESMPVSVSPCLSSILESSGAKENSSENATLPPAVRSPEPLALDCRSIEGPSVHATSDSFCDCPPGMTTTRNQEQSVDVDSIRNISGDADVHSTETKETEVAVEAIIEGPEKKAKNFEAEMGPEKKVNNFEANTVLGDISSQHDTATSPQTLSDEVKLGARSRETEDKGASSESLQLVLSEPTNIELQSKDHGGGVHLAVENVEIDHVDDYNMEVSRSDMEVPIVKDFVATGDDDNDGMQLRTEVGSTEDNDVDACNVEGRASSPKVIISELANIEKNHCNIDVQPGTENREGEHFEVCNVGANLSDANFSLPKDFPAESSHIEFIAEDHVGTSRVEKPKGDLDDTCNMQIDPPISQEPKCFAGEVGHQLDVSQDSRALMQYNLENTPPPSSSVTEEENVHGLCKEALVSISVALEQSQRLEEAKMDNQADASQLIETAPKDLSENMILPSSPSTTEDKNNRHPQLAVLSCAIAPEESKGGSEAKIIDQMDASQAAVIMPEITPPSIVLTSSSLPTEEENVEGLIDEGPVCSSIIVEESMEYAEKSYQKNVFEIGKIVPESTPKIAGLASPSAMEEEKIGGSFAKCPLFSSEEPMESKGSEGENDDETDSSQVRNVMPGITLENMVLSPSSVPAEENKVEDSLDKACGAIGVKRSEGSEANCVQIDVSHAGVCVPQNKTKGMVLQTSSEVSADVMLDGSEKDVDASEGSEIGMRELKIEGSSDKNELDISLAEELIVPESKIGNEMDVSLISPQADDDLPSSSSVMEDDRVESSFEKRPIDISTAIEECRKSETECGEQLVLSQVCGVVQQDTPVNLGLSEKRPDGTSVALEEGSKGSETETCDPTVVSQFGRIGYEDTQIGNVAPEDRSEHMDLSMSSSGMQVENIDGSRKIIKESYCSETHVDDQPKCSERVVENMSENTLLPSSSMGEEEINPFTGKDLIGSPTTLTVSGGSEVELVKQVDHLQVGGSSAEKIDALSEKNSISSPTTVMDSGGSEVEPAKQEDHLQVGEVSPEKIDVSSQKDPIGGPTTVTDLVGSEVEPAKQKDHMQVGGISPEKIDISSQKDLIGSPTTVTDSGGSEVEPAKQEDYMQVGGVSPEKIDPSSPKNPMDSPTTLMDSGGSEVEPVKQDDHMQVGGISPEKVDPSSQKDPIGSRGSEVELAKQEDHMQVVGISPEKVEPSSQKDLIGSPITVTDSGGSEVDPAKQEDHMQVDGMSPEKLDPSSQKDLIGSPITMMDSGGSEVEPAKQEDHMQVDGISPEKVDPSSQKNLIGSPITMMDSGGSEVEPVKQEDHMQVGGISPEKIDPSSQKDLIASPITMMDSGGSEVDLAKQEDHMQIGGISPEKIDPSSQEDQICSPTTLTDSGGSEVDPSKQVDHLQVGGISPEKIDPSSQEDPICSPTTLMDSGGSEVDPSKQVDHSQVGGISPEKIDPSSEQGGPTGSPLTLVDSRESEDELAKQVDHVEVGGITHENASKVDGFVAEIVSQSEGLPSSSLALMDAKGPEVKPGDQVDHLSPDDGIVSEPVEVGGIVPENASQGEDLLAASPVVEGEKLEDPSGKDSVCTSKSQEDLP